MLFVAAALCAIGSALGLMGIAAAVAAFVGGPHGAGTAARSVTDKLGIPHVYTTFRPINQPSPHQPPPQGSDPAINTHRVAIEAMVNA